LGRSPVAGQKAAAHTADEVSRVQEERRGVENSSVERTEAKRLVLGYDGGCSTCSGIARRIQEEIGNKLEIMSLSDPLVQGWREQSLGEDAPWTPTLFEVEGQSVRAWTGRRMGMKLAGSLGLRATWRVMQALGETNLPSGREITGARRLPVVSRGQFLKGAGGAAVAMSVMSGGALFPSAAQASTTWTKGPLAKQGVAKTYTLQSPVYQGLQDRLKVDFDIPQSKIRIDPTGNFAIVPAIGDNDTGRGVTANFYLDLKNRKVISYQHGVNSAISGGRRVSVYRDGTFVRRLDLYRDYVVTQNGTRMTVTQFKKAYANSTI
jgi:hypothetical protein